MKGYVMNVSSGVIYPSAQEACRRCAITVDAMSLVLAGKRKTTSGQYFSYVPDELIGYGKSLALFRRDKLKELAHLEGILHARVYLWEDGDLREVG